MNNGEIPLQMFYYSYHPGCSCLHLPPPPIKPPIGGRALRPQPAISPCRHQTAPCHPRPPPAPPPPAGILRSTHLRLNPIISPHIFIPTESTRSPLPTSPVSLSLSPSRRWMRQQFHSPVEADAPFTLHFLNIKLHNGESKWQEYE